MTTFSDRQSGSASVDLPYGLINRLNGAFLPAAYRQREPNHAAPVRLIRLSEIGRRR